MVAADYPRLRPNYAFDPASAATTEPITLTIPPETSVDPELALRAACAIALATHAGEVACTIAVEGGLVSGTIDPSLAKMLGDIAKVEPSNQRVEHRLRLIYSSDQGSTGQVSPVDVAEQDSALLVAAGKVADRGAIRVSLSFDTTLLPQTEASWLLNHIESAFDAIITLSASDHQLVSGLNLIRPSHDEVDILTNIGTSPPPASTYPPECTTLHSFFINSAKLYPDQPALVFNDSLTLTYSQLLTVASHLATHLINLGTITPGQVIPLCIDKRPEMIISMLAILLTGCAYVNLEPTWPAGRKETIVQEASEHGLLEPGVALVGGREEGDEWRRWGGRWLKEVVDPVEVVRPLLANVDQLDAVDRSSWATAKASDPAYLVYTSGSTGAPKGIVVEHRNVASFLSNYKGVFGRAVGERVLQFPSYAFDVMVVSIWDTFAVSLVVAFRPSQSRANTTIRWLG